VQPRAVFGLSAAADMPEDLVQAILAARRAKP
jgi:hypothetical protein